MGYKKILRNNLRFIIIMIFIVVLGLIGITYALRIGFHKPININVDTIPLSATISGDNEITGTNTMIPIEDIIIDENITDIIEGTFSDDRILKVQFNISNVESNPENTIYDIALHDLSMDCVLKTEDLKWRLYKGSELLSSGNFSPTFDISIAETSRLVLTNTQEILGETPSEYTFLMWISESCPKDISITECTSDMDQSIYLNKSISAKIKLELSTKTRKNLVRIKGTDIVCE